MTKKYEFTGKTFTHYDHTLHRIRALRDIPRLGVNAGDIGGWVEDHRNLSHDGDCWVYGEANVYSNARVSGNAEVYGEAKVCGNADVYDKTSITPINIIGLRWPITITENQMSIGCETHSHEMWKIFSDREIAEMSGRDALRFWHEHRDMLLALCERHAAKANKLKECEDS